MFENQIGFMATLGFAHMPAKKVVEQLREIGYNSVEWTCAHFHPRHKTRGELNELVEVTHNAGMAVSEVVIQQDYITLDDATREDRVRLTIETIGACVDTGVRTVNLFTGPAPWDPAAPKIPAQISAQAAWDMALDAFSRIVPVLEYNKIHGAVEGVWGHLCNDYFTTRVLIDHFHSEYLGVNFDPSHDTLKGNFDTGWLVRQWGKKAIQHVHLKDAAGIQEMGRFVFPFPGEGQVDWKGMFTALAEINYSGFLSVEFESFRYHQQVLRGDTVEAARRCMRDVRALLV